MQEAVDVASTIEAYEELREESTSANQLILDSIDDEGMKKNLQGTLFKDSLKGIKLIAYEADKILFRYIWRYGHIKRLRTGWDDDQEPSARTDQGSKRRRAGKEPDLYHRGSYATTDVFEAPAHQEFDTGVQSVPAVHESVQPWLSNLAQQDPRESFDELTDSTFDFSAFVMNRLNVQTLTHELACTRQKARQFYAFATSRESARDIYSKRQIIAVTKVEIVEWHDYKHLNGINKKSTSQKMTRTDQSEKARRFKPYSDPRDSYYENKRQEVRLMRIDPVTTQVLRCVFRWVRTALNVRLKN
ncbi:hypothetical protein Tco_0384930 [Tanacetum coccineum]